MGHPGAHFSIRVRFQITTRRNSGALVFSAGREARRTITRSHVHAGRRPLVPGESVGGHRPPPGAMSRSRASMRVPTRGPGLPTERLRDRPVREDCHNNICGSLLLETFLDFRTSVWSSYGNFRNFSSLRQRRHMSQISLGVNYFDKSVCGRAELEPSACVSPFGGDTILAGIVSLPARLDSAR